MANKLAEAIQVTTTAAASRSFVRLGRETAHQDGSRNQHDHVQGLVQRVH